MDFALVAQPLAHPRGGNQAFADYCAAADERVRPLLEEWEARYEQLSSREVSPRFNSHANTLHGHGKLTSSAPGSDKPDKFVYDPMSPVPNYDETQGVTAHNMIHHSKQYPSQLKITVVKNR